jgi:hypothetical protein
MKKINLILIFISMMILLSINIFSTNYNYTKVVDSSQTINDFVVSESNAIFTIDDTLIKKYTNGVNNLNGSIYDEANLVSGNILERDISNGLIIYCGYTTAVYDCYYVDENSLIESISLNLNSDSAIRTLNNNYYSGIQEVAITNENNVSYFLSDYYLEGTYDGSQAEYPKGLTSAFIGYRNYQFKTTGGYKYDADSGQGGYYTNNNGIVYYTVSHVDDQTGDIFACSNSSIYKINLGTATQIYNTTNCDKIDYKYDSNTERYILAYVGFDNKVYLADNMTSYNFQEQTQYGNIKDISINSYAFYMLSNDDEIYKTEYDSEYEQEEIINNNPIVNPFTVYVNSSISNSIYDIVCNYTTNNSDKSEYNFYRNNVTIVVLNMPFEVNSTKALYDYSDSFLTFQCGTRCPYWNSTGGHDGKGAYEYNATLGQSIYANMTNSQLNLTSYSMFAWLKPNAYNFKNPYNDFTRVIIAGVNGVSYYQMATQTSTKMIYCRNQYNTSDADQVEYHLTDGNFTPQTWYHVGCIDTGIELKIFVDGVLKNTTIKTYPNRVIASNPTGNTLTIGNIIPTGGTRVLNSTMDEVKIFNIGLSDRQASNEFLENKILSSEYFGNSDYKCSVYAFNTTAGTLSNETYSNNVYVTQYYKPNFTFNYPVNNYHYMDFNGYVNISIVSNDLINNYNCQINDSRFTKVSNSLFYNNTLENAIYNVSINCNDGYYNISKSIKFYIDDEAPFINNLDGLNDFTFVSEINTTFYIYDQFLYYINVSVIDTINNNVVYQNITYYNQTSITNVTLRVNPTLPDGNYTLKIYVADSLQNSPKISDKSLITSQVKNDYSSSIDINMYDSHIKKTITAYNKNNNAIKIKDLNFNYLNEWIDDGKHLKYLWNVDKSKLKYDDYFIITLSSNTNDNKMIYLNDKGRSRVIDSKNNLYFTFDDLVKAGYSVTYKQNINSVDIIVKQSLIEYNKKGGVVSYDPIVGGLNENSQEFNITVDSTPPTITVDVNSDYNYMNYNNTIYSTSKVTTGHRYDLNGIASYGVIVNGINYPQPINIIGYMSEVWKTIIYYAYDNAGNYAESTPLTIQVDNTAPRVTLTPINTYAYNSYFDFNYNIQEANIISKKIYVFKDNVNLIDENLSSTSGVYNLTNLTFGYYSISVEVYDLFNKENTTYIFYNMSYNPYSFNESNININGIGNVNNNTGTTCQDYNITFTVDNFDPNVNLAKYFGENPFNGIRVYEVTCPTIYNTTKTFQLENFIRTSGVSILCNDYLAYQNTSFTSCTPRNLTLTLEIYDNVTNTNTSYEINISIIDKLNYTIVVTPSPINDSTNYIYVNATGTNETVSMTAVLYQLLNGVWTPVNSYNTSGSSIEHTFTGVTDGTYKYEVYSTDKYGDKTLLSSDQILLFFEHLYWTSINFLSQSEVILGALIFFAFLGLICIGMIFNNPAFAILGYLFGVFFGIYFTRVNTLFGIFFIVGCIIGMLTTLKGRG